MEQFLVDVAIENVAYHFDFLYTYSVPESLRDRNLVGMRVMVPFGRGKNTKRQGVVFSYSTKPSDECFKEIYNLLDFEPVVSEEMLKIAFFLKERTFCTFFEGVKVQMPTGFSFKTTEKFFPIMKENITTLTGEEKIVYDYMMSFDCALQKKQILSSLNLSPDSKAIDTLIKKGFVKKTYEAVKKIGDVTQKAVSTKIERNELDAFKLTEKQRSVMDILCEIKSAGLKDICYFTGVGTGVVETLSKKGLLEITEIPKYRIPKFTLTKKSDEEIVLTNVQRKAFDGIFEKYKNGFGVSLLYGVTGSGKTSVFLSLIDKAIGDGKEVIVMVPEISLTPQMMAIFKGRYKNNVAIFHSALSTGERKDEYRRVRAGEVKIVVGTRSAVFAPFKNLGLIVIDEEQEHTYKSESSPRYHTKDVAFFRANEQNAHVLLSSATPSIEAFSLSKNGRYNLFTLPERYGNAVLPDVKVIDMKEERAKGNKYAISSALLEALEKNLENEKQSILLINRRGYNTFCACDSCGSVISCPSCSISLTYHADNNRLMCHYCGYSVPFIKTCPDCGKEDVRYAGYGTQKIEKELEILLPNARVLRMDTDKASSRAEFERGLSDFSGKKYDIMLGTQMVAKGLDFENVTLVGVISADQQLNNDDFRSQERTFDLLTQVVGRAGRGNFKGEAVIQTMTPENNVIKLAQTQDYESFFLSESIIRKAMVYPPYCSICAVLFVSEREDKALRCSNEFLKSLIELTKTDYVNQKIMVLGPMPPRISKMNNKFRYRLILKHKNNSEFRRMISELLVTFGKNKNFSDVSIVPDINPQSLV